MIAKTPKGGGGNFHSLSTYLQQEGKIEWAETRNTAPGDMDVAVKEMEHTAKASRAKKPVYHVSISWHPDDQPTKAQMIQVADRYLDHMGLKDHQAAIVSHKDSKHPHIHLMINRVHPTTGRAWDRWQDYKKMESFCRLMEKEYGWKHVPGKHSGRDPELDPAPKTWEIHRAEELRRKVAGLGIDPESIDTRSPKLKALQIKKQLFQAKSFGEFDGQLARQGLWLEAKGQGGVITDGYMSVKLSEVSRQFSAKKLEKSFGQRMADYIQTRDSGNDLAGGQEMVKEAMQMKFKMELYNAEKITKGMLRKISNDLLLFEKNSGAGKIKAELEMSFGRAFVDGKAAYANFVRNSTNAGIMQAYDDISNKPEKIGEVKNQTELYTITGHLRSYIQKNKQARGHVDGWLKDYYKYKLKTKQHHFRSAYLNIAKQNPHFSPGKAFTPTKPGQTASKYLAKAMSKTEAGRDVLKIKKNAKQGVQLVRQVIAFQKAFQALLTNSSALTTKTIVQALGGPKALATLPIQVVAMAIQELIKKMQANKAKELGR